MYGSSDIPGILKSQRVLLVEAKYKCDDESINNTVSIISFYGYTGSYKIKKEELSEGFRGKCEKEYNSSEICAKLSEKALELLRCAVDDAEGKLVLAVGDFNFISTKIDGDNRDDKLSRYFNSNLNQLKEIFCENSRENDRHFTFYGNGKTKNDCAVNKGRSRIDRMYYSVKGDERFYKYVAWKNPHLLKNEKDAQHLCLKGEFSNKPMTKMDHQVMIINKQNVLCDISHGDTKNSQHHSKYVQNNALRVFRSDFLFPLKYFISHNRVDVL